MRPLQFATLFALILCGELLAETPKELRIGRVGHAFDHLGSIGRQADAAAASGSTVIYASGVGELGYQGLPPQKEFATFCGDAAKYSRHAKQHGIELNIGYVCATSIVKLGAFDKNWSNEFRAQFKTRPSEWLQQDRQGKPLTSWYGGEYSPACMNNPDWRAYERAIVRYQLETGHDGIFFDNPTVHPKGCYCPHCMKAFAAYVDQEGADQAKAPAPDDTEAVRKFADSHPESFLTFRSTIARDFLADVRAFARTINPRALITCNNSLNAPSVFYSQSRMYGYNIQEMSKVEDLVVVEDMASQPRVEANGQTVEYGPVYRLLHGINHGKPIVAVTIANGDYHTPPNLMRLAMAEAAAHGASYLSWPTWPENQRERMIASVRPQADFLRQNEASLNDTEFRQEVALYSPFERWLKTDECKTLGVAAALTKENIQYRVVSKDELAAFANQKDRPVLLVESRAVLSWSEQPAVQTIEKSGPGLVVADQPDWMKQLRTKFGRPSATVAGAPNVRAVVHDQGESTIIQLYNLNIQRVSSFEDKVTPANDFKVALVTQANAGSARILTADAEGTRGPLRLEKLPEAEGRVASLTIPRLDISAIIRIDP